MGQLQVRRLSSLADAILSRGFPRWHHARHGRGWPTSKVGQEENGLMSLVRRYPLTAFFVLACVLSWWPWIPVLCRPLAQPYRGLRAVPGAGRAGSYRRQERCNGVTAAMVRW